MFCLRARRFRSSTTGSISTSMRGSRAGLEAAAGVGFGLSSRRACEVAGGGAAVGFGFDFEVRLEIGLGGSLGVWSRGLTVTGSGFGGTILKGDKGKGEGGAKYIRASWNAAIGSVAAAACIVCGMFAIARPLIMEI